MLNFKCEALVSLRLKDIFSVNKLNDVKIYLSIFLFVFVGLRVKFFNHGNGNAK